MHCIDNRFLSAVPSTPRLPCCCGLPCSDWTLPADQQLARQPKTQSSHQHPGTKDPTLPMEGHSPTTTPPPPPTPTMKTTGGSPLAQQGLPTHDRTPTPSPDPTDHQAPLARDVQPEPQGLTSPPPPPQTVAGPLLRGPPLTERLPCWKWRNMF